MPKIHKFSPKVECLEERLPLSGDLMGPLLPGPTLDSSFTAQVSEPSDPEPTSSPELIDPTEDPADPSNTTVTATITALGPLTNDGKLESIDVDGLPDNLSYLTPTLVVNGVEYEVDLVVALENGQYRLVVFAGIEPEGVSVGMDVTLVYGDGGTGDPGDPLPDPTPGDPTEPPPLIPPMPPGPGW